MNYRHAFHAGNHTEVFKHAALVLVLERLLEKPQPFAVLDTHAGIGLYDLTSEQALKTREYEDGIARLAGRELAAAPGYVRLVRAMNPSGLTEYPGSPEIIRRMLRDDDRLIACELHPVDAQTLKARYRRDSKVSVHHRDGYEAVGALLPPAQKRGLVFIDPPFEKKDDPMRLVEAMSTGLRRWSNGIYMAWYPIKDAKIGRTLSTAATSRPLPKTLRVEFFPYADDEASLPGSGLFICNTPWKLDERLDDLCEELSQLLGAGRVRWTVDWLTPS